MLSNPSLRFCDERFGGEGPIRTQPRGFDRRPTAAMRSQANTAKILEANPTLMRLRELEVVEKVVEKANLQVVLGEAGLADRLTRMI